MARLLRVQYAGAIYHVTLRGNGRMALFLDDRDRGRFQERLEEGIEDHGIRLYLYCLMTNHVHLVLGTPHGNLSAFMQALETAYTVYFNLRHGRSGHVTEGRFGAQMVEGDEYLLKLSRYVHLNPMFVGGMEGKALCDRVAALRDYRWSSYRSYVGEEKALGYVRYGPVLGMMRGSRGRRAREYRRFVEAGLAQTDEEFAELLHESRLSVGGESFRDWVGELHYKLAHGHGKSEDAAFRRIGRRLNPEDVLEVTCEAMDCELGELKERRHGSWVRPIAAKMLCKYAGLTQRQIAGWMGLGTGVSVCNQLQRLKGRMASDRKVARQVALVDKALAAKLLRMSMRKTNN